MLIVATMWPCPHSFGTYHYSDPPLNLECCRSTYKFLGSEPHKCSKLYRIAGNFRELVKNTVFTEKTFVDCSLLPHQRMSHPQILWRKLSRIATKLRNLQKFSSLKVSNYTYIKYIHVRWTCATMVAVVTLTGWVRPPPTKICYDDNDQDDNSHTNKSTYHSSCNSPCWCTTNIRGTCCRCCWSCWLSWWLSWWLRWLWGWCWRWCGCREWHTPWTQQTVVSNTFTDIA